MTSKKLKWNTGRGYSPDGQIIEAVFTPERIDDHGDQVGTLDFNDETRGIYGRYTEVRFTNRPISDDVFKTRVMDYYDRGGYEYSPVYGPY